MRVLLLLLHLLALATPVTAQSLPCGASRTVIDPVDGRVSQESWSQLQPLPDPEGALWEGVAGRASAQRGSPHVCPTAGPGPVVPPTPGPEPEYVVRQYAPLLLRGGG